MLEEPPLLNSRPAPPPGQVQLSLPEIINWRIGLEQIREPSEDIKTAIAKLDKIIATAFSALTTGA